MFAARRSRPILAHRRWAGTRDRGRRLSALAWGAVAGCAAVTMTWWAGIVVFPSMLAAQASLPLLAVPLAVVAAWATWRSRRELAAVAIALFALVVWAAVPLVRGAAPPDWAASSPRVRVVAANVFRGNPTPQAALDAVEDLDGDVVVLVEMTAAFDSALAESGLATTHPHRIRNGGDLILSRLPLVRRGHVGGCSLDAPAVSVEVGGRRVQVVGVHTTSPVDWLRRERWSSELLALQRLVGARRGETVVLAGDFNATRFHAPFATLLRMGAQDAHDTLGEGWRPSWAPRQIPVLRSTGVFRLDHALSIGPIAPLEVRDAVIPGSDHRALAVTYAVQPVVTGIHEGRASS